MASDIVEAGKYASVHTKNWVVPPKPTPLARKKLVKGPIDFTFGNQGDGKVRKERLPADELLHALWEDTDRQIKGCRYPDQEDFKNKEHQLGRGLWSNELIKRIIKLNKRLLVEDSISAPGCAAFYVARRGKKEYTNASFRKGFVPEFSIIETDDKDLPVRIQYGWRTVLLRLVKARCLTMNQVLRVFGDVVFNDSRGKHWDAYTRDFKT